MNTDQTVNVSQKEKNTSTRFKYIWLIVAFVNFHKWVDNETLSNLPT